MDYGNKNQGSFSPQNLPGRRTREERRSLSETLADGTSKFFSSMVAKKNGLFNDLSSKIENTFAPKTDTISNSTGSDCSGSPPNTPNVPCTPPPRPPPPKRLPSMGSSHKKENVMKRMNSMPAYSRTESRPETDDFSYNPANASRPFENDRDFNTTRGSRPVGGGGGAATETNKIKGEHYAVSGMNISFDKPIYAQCETNSKESGGSTVPPGIPGVSSTVKVNHQDSNNITMTTSSSASSRPEIVTKTMGGSRPGSVGSAGAPSGNAAANIPPSLPSTQAPSSGKPAPVPKPAPRSQRQPTKPSSPNERSDTSSSYHPSNEEHGYPNAEYGRGMSREINKSSSSGEWSDKGHHSVDSNRSNPDSSGSNSCGESQSRPRAPKFTTTKRRSSTVDEMLFDDYVEPEVDAVIVTDMPPENLICFEPDLDPDDSNATLAHATSVDSSDVEFGGTPVHRSGSMGSDKSWSSNYSLDSQPDDVTLECMEFMKCFVDKVFHDSEEITQTEKAKFGELCQYFPGRLWFSRYVNSQRVHNKRVSESVFFRLMQYFAVCMFECHEAEDFSPAKTLMNMCFTFFNEAPGPQGKMEKVFLYTYMRDQPIWQSLRFWNAAFFDAVQCERSRRPMPTSSAENETVTDDRQFQENITFGQLGTFVCNMHSFGLSRELCLEFLRKQSTIANLRKDQVKLLRDNIDRARDK